MSTQLNETGVSPQTLEPGGGERLWIAGDTMWFKATAADTGGAFTLIELLAAPGGGPPPHIHDNEEETFYVLDGLFEILIGEQRVRASRGAVAVVPRGTVHRFRCIGDRPGRMLIVFTPGGIEGFFRQAGRPATADGPAPPIDAAEVARTQAVAPRYGLRVVDWSEPA
jgi:quercetin dioxygenase-like cupin family protein